MFGYWFRWKGENNPSLCCHGGRVTLPRTPTPPPELMNLWYDNTQEARLFRQHSRSVNNASCLSSIVVNERNHEAGISSVVMMGKLTQLVGSLEPENREQAKFSQLYVVDPATEATCREGCFYLPTSLSISQKRSLTETMWNCVSLLKRVNPLVRDFKMACEQFAEENIKDGRVVISADARPSLEHERRYNLQVIKFAKFVVSCSIINIATSSILQHQLLSQIHKVLLQNSPMLKFIGLSQ